MGRTADRARIGEKILEDAGIKLASVASRTLGVSGREMIEQLIAGERNPGALADLARNRLRNKIGDLERALVGSFDQHHATMIRFHLVHIDELTAKIADLDRRIAEAMSAYSGQLNLGIPPFRGGMVYEETPCQRCGGSTTRSSGRRPNDAG